MPEASTAIADNSKVDPLATVWKKHGYAFQDFTPEERSCISGKISTLVKEGYEQDQAAAIAIKHCAPGKSKSEKANLRDDIKIGGNYTAVDNGDGTFDVKDVFVFAEVPEGAKRNKKPIGKDWQDAAVARNKAREAEGHLPPVHLYHSNEVSVKPVYAGKLRLKGTKQVRYQGDQAWATFGDILGMPGEVFEKVRKGFVPYRSVEINDWDKPEIDALALMDTDVPYFRMEMLTIGKIIKKGVAEMFIGGRKTPAFACRIAEAPAMAVLFRFGDDDKTGDEKVGDPANKEDEKDGQIVSQGVDEEVNKAAGSQMEEEKKIHVEDKEKGAPMPGEEEHEAKEDAKMDRLIAMVGQLISYFAPKPVPQEKLEPASGYEFKVKPAQPAKEKTMLEPKDEKTPVAMTAADLDRATATIEAKFSAKYDKLNAELATERKEKAQAAKYEGYLDQLKGRAIGAATKKALFRMIQLGVDDKEVAETVGGWKAEFPAEPPADADSFETMLAGVPGNGASMNAEADGAVNAFCAKHPEAASWAREQVKGFSAWKRASGTDMTFEEALETAYRAKSARALNRV